MLFNCSGAYKQFDNIVRKAIDVPVSGYISPNNNQVQIQGARGAMSPKWQSYRKK